MHRKIRLGSGFAAGVLDEQGRLGKIFRSGRLVGLDCKEMRVSPFHIITGLVPVIPIRKALRFTESGWPGLIPGSSPGTAMTGRVSFRKDRLKGKAPAI
jgi:hypothetical protein